MRSSCTYPGNTAAHQSPLIPVRCDWCTMATAAHKEALATICRTWRHGGVGCSRLSCRVKQYPVDAVSGKEEVAPWPWWYRDGLVVVEDRGGASLAAEVEYRAPLRTGGRGGRCTVLHPNVLIHVIHLSPDARQTTVHRSKVAALVESSERPSGGPCGPCLATTTQRLLRDQPGHTHPHCLIDSRQMPPRDLMVAVQRPWRSNMTR